MSQLPYYITWQNQTNPKVFELNKYDGALFELSNGKKLIDLSSTSYHTSFGGNPKAIVQKVIEGLQSQATACPKALTKDKFEASQKLLNFMQKKEGRIYYTLSGSESIENALKMARQITNKKVIVARRRSYHGATLGALGVTGDWRNQGSIVPDEWTLRIPEPFEDPDFSKSQDIILKFGKEKIAALIIEPVSAANGVIIPSKEWLFNQQKFCKENNILLIYDEVCTGFQRIGTRFAYQRFQGLDPDMICLGKNISGGVFPFGAIWTNQTISDYFHQHTLLCGSTNYAHPGGIAAMEAVIEILEDQVFVDSLEPLTKTFQNALDLIAKHHQVKEVRQIGLLAAVELNSKVEWLQLIDAGVYCGVHGDYLTFAPPYIISGQELLEGFKRIETILDQL